jgi:hypothetical protein
MELLLQQPLLLCVELLLLLQPTDAERASTNRNITLHSTSGTELCIIT